jgi:hypothetical protein
VKANTIDLDKGALGWMPALSPPRDEVVEQGERAKSTNDAGNRPSVEPGST